MTSATLKALTDVYGTLLEAGWGELPDGDEAGPEVASPVIETPNLADEGPTFQDWYTVQDLDDNDDLDADPDHYDDFLQALSVTKDRYNRNILMHAFIAKFQADKADRRAANEKIDLPSFGREADEHSVDVTTRADEPRRRPAGS